MVGSRSAELIEAGGLGPSRPDGWRQPRPERRTRRNPLRGGRRPWMASRPFPLPSAGSGGLLCEGLGERAAVVVAQALLKLLGGELAIRLDHGPLAVHPLGLDRVEPWVLARQAADQKPAAAVALDPAVVGRDPGAHRAADVPGGVVPNQEQGPHALGRELAG